MTRILRLLLIAAIALPLWQPIAAQVKVGAPEPIKVPHQESVDNLKDLNGNAKTTGLIDEKQLSQTKRRKNVSLRSHVESFNKTVCEGEEELRFVPIFGYYLDGSTYGQMIYPAETLGLQEGDVIKSISFYGNEAFKTEASASLDANVTLRLGETDATTITSTTVSSNRTSATSVYSGTIPTSDENFVVTFTLSSEYTYNGGNLIVDLYRNSGSNCTPSTHAWKGVAADLGSSYYYYYFNSQSGTATSQGSFLPQMKITFERVVPDPYEATIDGNFDFGKVVVDQTARATFTVTNTGTNAFTPVLSITDDDGNVFALRNTDYGVLEPGESRYFVLSFTPTALQNYSAALVLTAEESAAAAINITNEISGIGSETAEMGVGQGDDTESLPVYLYYLNNTNHGQIIYNASDLKLSKGTLINKITFHANNALRAQNTTGTNYGSSGTITLKIGETTEQSTYSSTTFLSTTGFTTTSLSNIYTGTKEVTFTFSTPYEYQGGNLVIDASGNGGTRTASSVLWEGSETSSYVGLIQYYVSGFGGGTQTTQKKFLPYITIDCVPAEIEGRDLVVTDPEDWEGFKYNWPIGTTDNESDLSQIATDPDQIIAMLREVYTNKAIPGNYKRGFTESGLDDHDNEVMYTGIGTINSSHRYADSYGWNIPAKEGSTNTSEGINNVSSSGYDYWYMNEDEYKPDAEGVTLLLLEMVDNFNPKTQDITKSTSSYAELRDYVSRAVKSARIIKNAKRTGKGLESGTLFKIDCDKMNKFYLLAKGQLMWFKPRFKYNDKSYYPSNPYYAYPYYLDCDFTIDNATVSVDEYLDYGVSYDYLGTCAFLGHMFEQFSPSVSSSGSEDAKARDDIYQDLINMHSFGVVHDCPNVPYVGHHFMMYGSGEDGQEIADAQDVRDMMFFVPDYRMMDWFDRGNSEATSSRSHDYFRYNPVMQPTMGLYVIRQKEITPTTAADEYYMLNLNWVTNLDEFLPSDQQEFELFEVVVNEETGAESYVPVYYKDANGNYTKADGSPSDTGVPIVLTMNPGKEKNYPSVYVKREEASKEVTYIIRGRDVTIVNGERKHFLSLQYSNKMSYIVPGTDPSELVLLEDATHYSRFDAERIRNAYSNKLEMNNNVDGMKQANLTSSSQMTISRVAQVPTGSTAGVTTDPVTVATVTFNPSTTTYTVQMANQVNDETEFPECADGSFAGYHANNYDKDSNSGVVGNGSWTGSYTVNNGNIELGSLVIFDNFVQAIPDDNSHPFGYIYNVTTNYPCVSNAVFLNAAACTNGDEDWYAYTWRGDVNSWIKGVDAGDGLLRFSPVKPGSGVVFARVNPDKINEDGAPESWANDVIWNRTVDLSFTDKDTYKLDGYQDGGLHGYWESADKNNATAHGNTFRIPIYKTSSQINGIFSQTDVDNDKAGVVGKIGDADLPENVEFGVGVSLNSKTEVLRYDTYRWPEGDPRYTVQEADGDDEEDIAPSGQAMNQGESYTITMNGDTNYETNGEVSVSSGSATATFVDKYPGLGDNAGAYIYAPIVEAFSGRGEGDYNTYGGPLQSSASGRFDGQRDTGEPPMSSYYWEEGGKRYAYYTIQFSVDRNIKMVPDDYDIYKIRVWRKIDDKSLLKEEYATQSPQIAARMGDENGTYMYEISYDEEDGQVMAKFEGGASLGSIEMKEVPATVTGANGSTLNLTYALGTFGAQKLRTTETEAADLAKVIEQLDLTYVVRLYFTRSANLSSAKGAAEGADGKYYIVEQEIPVTLKGGIPTAVENITSREVVGVKYYNVAGIESNKPFDGVNIVVTRYSDGSTTTTKILK